MSLKGNWELTILDCAPPASDLASLAVRDVDGDGNLEIIAGGNGALIWYRPSTLETGIIGKGRYAVGLAVEDIDNDGNLEVTAGFHFQKTKQIVWFKSESGMDGPWTRHEIDPDCTGGVHDIVFVDIDGDGEKEAVAAAPYGDISCVYLYKRNKDVTQPWSRYLVHEGAGLEGTVVADFDGDGRMEILCGPEMLIMPEGGCYSGPWRVMPVAPSFREMCRTARIDMSGSGRRDVIVLESEYREGKLSWFENRMGSSDGVKWVEHEIDDGLVYAHSLSVWRDEQSKAIHIFVGEMTEGGWKGPRNFEARMIEYRSTDNGHTWSREILSQGVGTHEAIVCDIDGDGELEIIGKEWGKPSNIPQMQLWKRASTPSPIASFRHRFVDRSKSVRSTDILSANVSGNGHGDIFCGPFRYEPSDNRTRIPGICQVVAAADIDGDGREELIAVKPGPADRPKTQILNNELCWLKQVDGEWREYPIGVGKGDWPHGTLVAPVLPGRKLALITTYHSAHARPDNLDYPEIFEIPDDPASGPWPKRTLAEVLYGEEIRAADLTGNGLLDLVAGAWWLENKGDGTFTPHQIAENFYAARLAIADINGDGLPDVVLGEEVLDYPNKLCPYSRLAWFENPGAGNDQPWKMHVIDKVRCPHSVDMADLDADGVPEIVCAEHDPFCPEARSQCRLYVYKKADPMGLTWKRFMVDDRFEHHDGAKVYELQPGKKSILSHGWSDFHYVHVWEQ